MAEDEKDDERRSDDETKQERGQSGFTGRRKKDGRVLPTGSDRRGQTRPIRRRRDEARAGFPTDGEEEDPRDLQSRCGGYRCVREKDAEEGSCKGRKRENNSDASVLERIEKRERTIGRLTVKPSSQSNHLIAETARWS